MKATILDTRIENGSECYLCKISLDEYIKSLPETYQEYTIQRQIVSNVYLDNLIKTVLSKKHIPPIVLVLEKGGYEKTNEQEAKDKHEKTDQLLDITNFKILDGLQRTHRLKIIYDSLYFYDNLDPSDKNDLVEMKRYTVSRRYSEQLRLIDSNTKILFLIKEFAKQSQDSVLECLKDNYQWFEVWANLTPDQEVQKMLVLNAGHKPVNIRHQLELLFLNLLDDFEKMNGFKLKIIREKEQSSSSYFKNRQKGQFHFAQLIASLLSFDAGKPVTTNINLVQSIQNDQTDTEQQSVVLNLSFLKEFIRFLLELDEMLSQQYGDEGSEWLGREVVITGIMGALGDLSKKEIAEDSKEKEGDNSKEILRRFLQIIKENPHILNVSQFDTQRLSLDWSKVNIGNINKSSVFEAIENLMKSQDYNVIDWEIYYSRYSK